MEKETVILTVPEQVKVALDGRTQRWLSFGARISEYDLSKKLNGTLDFSQEELDRINEVLKSEIKFTNGTSEQG